MPMPNAQYTLWANGWPDLEPVRGDAAGETLIAIAHMERFIKVVARAYAPNDRILADDLKQAARIWLWDVDPTRLCDGDAAFVRNETAQAIRNAKRREWRTEGGRFRVPVPPVHRGPERMSGSCVNAGVRFAGRPGSLRECLEWFQTYGRM
jgi:hypothetical protein